MDWWTHLQFDSRYGKDKQEGFYIDQTPFDRILLESNEKHIKKIYNFFVGFRDARRNCKRMYDKMGPEYRI